MLYWFEYLSSAVGLVTDTLRLHCLDMHVCVCVCVCVCAELKTKDFISITLKLFICPSHAQQLDVFSPSSSRCFSFVLFKATAL